MEKIILIIIIIAFLIYKILDRICEAYENTHMQPSEEYEYKVIQNLIEENEKLTDKLLEEN